MSFRSIIRTSLVASATFASLALQADPANACGGLFCSNATPVNQAAERIIFAQNDDGTVTAAIEIMYEGPAHEFAWVLPVPAGPVDVGVSSKDALDRLNQASNPVYQLNTQFDDGCALEPQPIANESAPDSVDDVAESSPVTVVDEGNAGPYVWTQLMVDAGTENPEDAAIMWLEANGYDVAALGPELLREYLVDGQNLIAFKLQKGKDSGSIRPVMLTYDSERPIIPIKPTAVAANADMSVKVWVLGDSRAIPSNFAHLEINQAQINWFNPGSNYDDVIIAAADEANEGHGFVTEQSGPAGEFTDMIYPQFEEDNWDELRTGRFGSVQEFLQTSQNMFGNHDGYRDVLADPSIVPLRDGATIDQFLSCISCYFETDVPVRNEAYPETLYEGASDPIHQMDVMLFLNEFHRLVIEPLESTAELFESHSSVTRFYTTISPDEMTVDPEFDFNSELGDVDNLRQATQIMQCSEDDTEWRIELPQGMIIRGNGREWPVTEESNLPFNLRILQLSTEGEGEVLNDNAELIANMLTDLDLGEALPTLMDPPETELDPEPSEDPDDDVEPTETDPEGDDPIGDGPQIDGMTDVDGTADDDDAMTSAGGGGCSVGSTGNGAGAAGLLALLGLSVFRRRRRS